MEHLLLKATVTTRTTSTDQGTFEAVISTQNADRERDIVSAPAMVTALQKWNRPIPLSWNHSTAAQDIFGSVDPQSAVEKDGEVLVKGQVDLESQVGKEAWRSFKSRTVGFSFGYLILEAANRKGGGRSITGLDVFEVTATPTPMNNDTRVLATKAAEEHLFTAMELEGALAGELKAVWTAAYINDLPDSAFLHIEPGGTKDDQGNTTPRSLRYFPYKDASGNVDMPHLRNALARISQSDLSQNVKDQLTSKAQRIMADSSKSVDVASEERSRVVDPLRKQARELAREVMCEGVDDVSGQTKEAPKQRPVMDPDELRRHSRELILQVLSE
jgi:HK97 family phage prohead protease